MRETTVHEIGEIKDTNQNQLLKMWQVQVPAGKRPLRPHQHLRFEIMLVNEGSGTYTTDRGEYPICPGDVFVFSSNEFHCITDVGPDGLKITNLHFEPTYLRGNSSDSQSAMNINFCFSHHTDFSNRIPATISSSPAFLIQKIVEELTARKEEYSLSVRSLLNLLLITLLRDHGYADERTDIKDEHLRNIQRVLTHIDEHFNEKITLQDLSELAGLTPNYFCTLFKEICGFTPWNYVNARRIDKAIAMILQDGIKINLITVATECGFNNTANFNKTFKKVTGMTPSEYRSSGHALIS